MSADKSRCPLLKSILTSIEHLTKLLTKVILTVHSKLLRPEDECQGELNVQPSAINSQGFYQLTISTKIKERVHTILQVQHLYQDPMQVAKCQITYKMGSLVISQSCFLLWFQHNNCTAPAGTLKPMLVKSLSELMVDLLACRRFHLEFFRIDLR